MTKHELYLEWPKLLADGLLWEVVSNAVFAAAAADWANSFL